MSTYLDASWVARNGHAGYSDVGIHSLRQPGLSQTYVAARLLVEAGGPVWNREGAAWWLNSLQQDSGAYTDPDAFGSPLQSTHYAVMAMNALGARISDPDDTVAFIESLRNARGLVLETGDDAMNRDAWYQSAFALEILQALDTAEADAPAASLAAALEVELDDALDGYMIDGAGPASHKLVVLAHSLANYDPALIDARARTALENSVQHGIAHPDGRSVSLLDMDLFVDTLNLVDPGRDSDWDDGLAAFVKEEVLPQLEHIDACAAHGRNCELGTATGALRLARHAGVPTETPGLDFRLAADQLESGWIRAGSDRPQAIDTRAAVTIAPQISYPLHDDAAIRAFLISELTTHYDAPQDLLSATFALEALQRLALPIDQAVLDELQTTATVTAERSAQTGDPHPLRYALYWYGRLALALGWQPTETLVDAAQRVLEEDVPDAESASVVQLSRLAVLQKAYGHELIGDDELAALVFAYHRGSGGFVSGGAVVKETLEATHTAIQTLLLLDRADDADWQGVRDLVMRSKVDYGFAPNPTDSVTYAKVVHISRPSLRSTSQAVDLLVWEEAHTSGCGGTTTPR